MEEKYPFLVQVDEYICGRKIQLPFLGSNDLLKKAKSFKEIYINHISDYPLIKTVGYLSWLDRAIEVRREDVGRSPKSSSPNQHLPDRNFLPHIFCYRVIITHPTRFPLLVGMPPWYTSNDLLKKAKPFKEIYINHPPGYPPIQIVRYLN